MTENCTPIELVVHPGIGDLSWIFSKLSTTGEKFDLVIAEDLKTQRAMPLVEMVECINSARYGGHSEYYPLAKCGNSTFADYKKAGKEGKKLYMTANNWLEKGKRLEGYLPDLETDFHYKLDTSPQDDWAAEKLAGHRRLMGIYTSGAEGIKVWNGWSHLEWTDFIRQVDWQFPYTTFVFLGAQWDMDMREPMLKMMEEYRIDYLDFIGKTDLIRATAIIKQLDYFAGYASGLTILANVVRTPVLMLYPNHLVKLINSWPSVESMIDGTYQGHTWQRPYEIFERIKSILKDYV